MLYQFCYCSTASTKPPEIFDDLRSILTEAYHFNHYHEISGVLYYADGYFFQCVEGEKQHLDQLVEKLKKDQRHKDLKFYGFKIIAERNFAAWKMKYVARHSEIKTYLSDLGFDSFNLNDLDDDAIDILLDILTKADEQPLKSPD
ncbi:BLUF domain-containing protein [Acinetobacter sp. 194]|uniref:BLUF domain-containing protein n=1 Tax=Acinetobacter shaoyimingii TaxID=2715164 RepID=UPI0014085BD7|nr:BLUF domain-containing protein [Acinetobacter shaoyimingii]NHB57131.1 BLUF domain-containing protein [Acinetobacter shaoyimingii]